MDLAGQLALMDEAGIDTRVLSAPASMLNAPGQPMPPELMALVNDELAELVATHAGRLLALATIDVFQGQVAAREVERALQLPGIGGIVIDCAQGDRFLDFPEARPSLEVAASLGAPVFVHPVSPAGLTERLARLGHTGTLLARGTEDAASLLALMRSGLLDALPNLRLVLPMIGAAALLFAGLADLEYEHDSDWQGTRPALARTRLYVDTMGFDPAALRFAIDVLGPEHVLLGSDWPIMPLPTRRKIDATLDALALSSEQQALIMGGNTERLLKYSAP
jgi:predicted TIM-barrel fold metal-dependent hydrolase